MVLNKNREDSEKLIELYAEIGLDDDDKPQVLRVHPSNYSNKEILNSVPSFTYPCSFQWFVFFFVYLFFIILIPFFFVFFSDVVTHFSFVLTNSSSKWTFGFCRHTPNSDHCVVVLSDLPWHSAFYKILDYCVELESKSGSSANLERFLNALLTTEIPQPGLDLYVTFVDDNLRTKDFKTSVPDHQRLPAIPEDVSLVFLLFFFLFSMENFQFLLLFFFFLEFPSGILQNISVQSTKST